MVAVFLQKRESKAWKAMGVGKSFLNFTLLLFSALSTCRWRGYPHTVSNLSATFEIRQ